MVRKYAAVDLGASSGRVCVGTLDEGRLTLEEVHRFPNGAIHRDGALRWDFPRLAGGVVDGLRKLAATGQEPAGIGVDCWGLDTGFIDAEGGLLGLPYSYQDGRTAAAAPEIARAFSKHELLARTGAPCSQLTTLHQLLATHRAQPELLSRAARMLFISDLMHHHLTGEAVAERTMASTSQMYSMATGNWDRELLDRLGLPTHMLPVLVSPGCALGPLRRSLAAELGWAACPVHVPACHDTASAMAAAPVESPQDAILSIGTWSMLGLIVETPVVSEEAAELMCGNYVIPGPEWVFIRGIMGLFLLERFRREEGLDDVEALVAMAEEAPMLRSLVVPDDPVLLGGASLVEQIRAYCRETDQPVPEDTGQVARTIFESLALFHDQALRTLARLAQRRLERLVMVGGGSRNRLLNQLTADATGLLVVTSVAEATAAGNVLVQAVAAGDLGSVADIRPVVARSWPSTTYEPRLARFWASARDRYHALASRARPEAP